MVLSTRAVNLQEAMDRPDCDIDQLRRTYRHFGLVNTAVAGWSLLYRRFLYPAMLKEEGKTIRILDIGCGGGDVLRRLIQRSKRDGFAVEALGIDPDERAIEFACQTNNLPGLRFESATLKEIAAQGKQFSIVLSNHVLHHLADEEISPFCEASHRVASRLVLHNDIHRHPLAYASFPLIGGLFPNSLILSDGMRSIRRSFTPAELRELVGPTWEVHTSLPFRCILLCRK